jgi:hypothetical protein
MGRQYNKVEKRRRRTRYLRRKNTAAKTKTVDKPSAVAATPVETPAA